MLRRNDKAQSLSAADMQPPCANSTGTWPGAADADRSDPVQSWRAKNAQYWKSWRQSRNWTPKRNADGVSNRQQTLQQTGKKRRRAGINVEYYNHVKGKPWLYEYDW